MGARCLRIISLLALKFSLGISQNLSCVSSITELVSLESIVQDYSQLRSYTLCSNSAYQVGDLDYSNHLINTTGSPPIPIRPNLQIKCGPDGSRSNNCFVYGGNVVQVDATGYFGVSNGSSISIDNVLISGITFSDAQGYSVWATRPGNITFSDCEFQVMTLLCISELMLVC